MLNNCHVAAMIRHPHLLWQGIYIMATLCCLVHLLLISPPASSCTPPHHSCCWLLRCTLAATFVEPLRYRYRNIHTLTVSIVLLRQIKIFVNLLSLWIEMGEMNINTLSVNADTFVGWTFVHVDVGNAEYDWRLINGLPVTFKITIARTKTRKQIALVTEPSRGC